MTTALNKRAAALAEMGEPAPDSVLQANMRETWEAMVTMRNAINEYVPMPSLESDLLQGPENSIFCATVADAVINHIQELTNKCQILTERVTGATTNGLHGSDANAPGAADSSEPAPDSVREAAREAARVLLDAARIERVQDTIERSVRFTVFCDALRAIAEGKDDG